MRGPRTGLRKRRPERAADDSGSARPDRAFPGDARHNGLDVPGDEGRTVSTSEAALEIPSYLVYFGIPPSLATIVISFIDPMAGLVLLVLVIMMVVTLKILFRFGG
jgi:hypothetical protein